MQRTGRSGLIGNRDGIVLPMAAVGLILMMALVGGGVDISRAYMVQNKLQSACDAAVLVGRKSVGRNGFDGTALAAANRYFQANFNEAEQDSTGTSFTATSNDNGNSVSGQASTTLNTVLMKLFGKDQLSLSATCNASMGVGNVDVTMVLDTTGSMANSVDSSGISKINALRAAMKAFYRTVEAATAAGNARIRYAFAPYSTTVNVGRLLKSDYLVNRRLIQSKVPLFQTVTSQELDHWGDPVRTEGTGSSDPVWANAVKGGTAYKTQAACLAAKPADLAWTNNGASYQTTSVVINANGQRVETTTTAQPQGATTYFCSTSGSRWYIYSQTGTRELYSHVYQTSNPVYKTVVSQRFERFEYRQREYDTSAYKLFQAVDVPLGTDGANISTKWAGCIEERGTLSGTTFQFVSGAISPSGAFDLDLDLEPDPTDPRTQWAPMWPEVSFYRTTTSGGSTPTNVDVSQFGRSSNAACGQQATLLREWTAQEFSDYADSLVARGNTYHDIGMIWGGRISSPDGIFADSVNDEPDNGGEVSRHILFMTDGTMEPSNVTYSAYGIEFHDRRVTTDGATSPALHNSRFLAVCQAIKAKGIRIWVIAFGTQLTSNLVTCASDNSAFLASSAAELTNTFTEIANQVGELRIVQ